MFDDSKKTFGVNRWLKKMNKILSLIALNRFDKGFKTTRMINKLESVNNPMKKPDAACNKFFNFRQQMPCSQKQTFEQGLEKCAFMRLTRLIQGGPKRLPDF